MLVPAGSSAGSGTALAASLGGPGVAPTPGPSPDFERVEVPVGALLPFLRAATKANGLVVGDVQLPFPVNPDTFANAEASHARLTAFANSVLKATVDQKRHLVAPATRCVLAP